MHKLRFLFLVLCCLICCLTAQAQDMGQKCPPGTDCPQKEKAKMAISPETVIVTAGFQDGAITLEPTKLVIDMTKFEASNSVDRVEDVLKHITGIDVIQGISAVDPQQQVMMRGFDDTRFQVAINGRPITAPSGRNDTPVDWASLTTGDIERIEVIRGPASARYDNSVGGIINIITKKGQRERGLTPKATAEASYSSFNTWNTRGTLRGGAGPLGYFIGFGNTKSDGYLRNNHWDGIDYSGRLDYALPGKGSLSSTFKRSELEQGLPVVNDPNSPYSDYDPDYPLVRQDADTIRQARFISYPGGKALKQRKSAHFDINYDQPLGHTNLSFRFFTDHGSEDNYLYMLNESAGELEQDFEGQDARRENTWGGMFDYQINKWSRHSLSFGYIQRRTDTTAAPDLYRMQGAYVEDQYALTNKLTLSMGLRYTHVRNFSYAYKAEGEKKSIRHLLWTGVYLPKFTATYRISANTEVFAGVNRDYHVPGC